jgi:hypothetical protein
MMHGSFRAELRAVKRNSLLHTTTSLDAPLLEDPEAGPPAQRSSFSNIDATDATRNGRELWGVVRQRVAQARTDDGTPASHRGLIVDKFMFRLSTAAGSAASRASLGEGGEEGPGRSLRCKPCE